MDGRQFDSLSRSFASRSSRRGLIRAGGAGAALAGLFGIGRFQAGAQADDFERTDTGLQPDGSCHFYLEANIRIGPSSGTAATAKIAGLLALRIGENGGIDNSTLRLENGTIYPVIGQASGRSISLRISIGAYTLIAVGAGERNIRSCAGEMGGPLTGPVPGDLGDWTAWPVGGGEEAPEQEAEPTPTTAPPQQQQPQQPPATNCADIPCGGVFVRNPTTCECVCPQGTTFCNNNCITCGADEFLDTNTCTCVSTACPDGQQRCNGICTDVFWDTVGSPPQHCGACNSPCPDATMQCLDGRCVCRVGFRFCESNNQCWTVAENCP